jgi:2-methylcitrate dehydratase PrpD
MDAVVAALGGSAPADVLEIVARVPEPAVSLVLEPAAAKSSPRTAYDAKFSLPYSIGAMLVHGGVDLDTYRDAALADERVRAIARKVRYEIVPFATFPRAFPGAARVVLRDGRTLEAELPHQRGGPENPLAAAEVIAKFRKNAAMALSKDSVARLEISVLALERQADAREAFAVLGEAQPSL